MTAPLLPPEEGRVENLLFPFCSVLPLAPRGPLPSPVGSRVRSENVMHSPTPPAQPWSQVSVAPHTQTPLRDALPFELGPCAPLRCPTAGTSVTPLVPLVRSLGALLELGLWGPLRDRNQSPVSLSVHLTSYQREIINTH